MSEQANIVQLLAKQQEQFAQQQELLNKLTQIIAGQQGVYTVSSSVPGGESSVAKAHLMESLANSMTDFHYEPDSGLLFESWYNRFRHIFEREASALDDADKVGLLWRKMSNHIHECFKNFVLPKQPQNLSLADTIKNLTCLFGRTETQVSLRYNCLQTTKKESEDFKEYASRVSLQCELFKLGDLTTDQFKCFIIGLKTSQDSDKKVTQP
uniref:DUF7083 domain-containing protein n=1 Tax=Musca domestica TaxID=7370 RepID=A0A1I8NCP0_MUSDO